MATEQRGSHQIQVLLRQDPGEVVRFLFFVLVILGALFALMPQARTAPAPWLGLGAVALGWCAIAASACELYDFDGAARTVRVPRVSLLGRARELRSLQDVTAVQAALRGPDDDRQVVELITRGGEVRLRLPRRLNTLSASDQHNTGRVIARTLGAPFRRAPGWPEEPVLS